MARPPASSRTTLSRSGVRALGHADRPRVARTCDADVAAQADQHPAARVVGDRLGDQVGRPRLGRRAEVQVAPVRDQDRLVGDPDPSPRIGRRRREHVGRAAVQPAEVRVVAEGDHAPAQARGRPPRPWRVPRPTRPARPRRAAGRPRPSSLGWRLARVRSESGRKREQVASIARNNRRAVTSAASQARCVGDAQVDVGAPGVPAPGGVPGRRTCGHHDPLEGAGPGPELPPEDPEPPEPPEPPELPDVGGGAGAGAGARLPPPTWTAPAAPAACTTRVVTMVRWGRGFHDHLRWEALSAGCRRDQAVV